MNTEMTTAVASWRTALDARRDASALGATIEVGDNEGQARYDAAVETALDAYSEAMAALVSAPAARAADLATKLEALEAWLSDYAELGAFDEGGIDPRALVASIRADYQRLHTETRFRDTRAHDGLTGAAFAAHD